MLYELLGYVTKVISKEECEERGLSLLRSYPRGNEENHENMSGLPVHSKNSNQASSK
jgi:hypothetical protein